MAREYNIELSECAVCGKSYYKKKKPSKNPIRVKKYRGVSIRRSTSRTCCTKCSKQWTKLRGNDSNKKMTLEKRRERALKQKIYSKRHNEKKRREKLYKPEF